MFNPRFLVVSLGNPLPRYESLHSAGHFALNGLAQVLRQPSFREVTFGNQTCLVSQVIVHDELEKDLGIVRLTAWDRSHKGHNGIKSVKGSLSQNKYPTSPFVRIAVGIGRPAERDPETVSRYVLDRISSDKRRILEEEAPWKVAECLVELEKEWKAELKT
ncbi:Putative peptidyl-tRNA hydrolase [Fusarium odoratissimum]|uniref:peptidyl-tRNA hydrolase n=1 Tax=Fusarium oxysporum f. sp. cubense (strain race 4) TaxID=2502994 RepID=N1RKW8_FUSC4|nr:Putative peptidyl-tRNA hydrolase [Fusarium odoratissimum]